MIIKNIFLLLKSKHRLKVLLFTTFSFLSLPMVAAEEQWIMPITEHNQPDLQGIWYFGSATPFQRPVHLGTQSTYSDTEVIALENELLDAEEERFLPLDPTRSAPESGGRISQQSDSNFITRPTRLVKVKGEYRTSIIIDPPNGRRPSIRDDFTESVTIGSDESDANGPEELRLSTRCLMWGAPIPSMAPQGFNANLQIVQTSDYVMMMSEMIHDVRIIRLDATHFDNGNRYWMGDSIGHWEGNTLVVHTKDFRLEQSRSQGLPLSEEFESIEKFTLTAQNEILYSYTVTDEKAYTESFTAERTITRRPKEERMYEFACHEGNYSIIGILAGARTLERNSISDR